MTCSPSGISDSSETTGIPAVRGFLPVPITLTMSSSAGTSEKPFMRRFISMILIASSAGTSLERLMLTLPWTKLSITSFVPVSVS